MPKEPALKTIAQLITDAKENRKLLFAWVLQKIDEIGPRPLGKAINKDSGYLSGIKNKRPISLDKLIELAEEIARHTGEL